MEIDENITCRHVVITYGYRVLRHQTLQNREPSFDFMSIMKCFSVYGQVMTHITWLRIYYIFIYLHKMTLYKISTKIQPHSHQTLFKLQSTGSSAIWLKEEMRPDTNVECHFSSSEAPWSTHWGRYKMADILLTTYWNMFPLIEIITF